MALAVLRIRVRAGVLIIGRPGQLHDVMDFAHDAPALGAAIHGMAGDRVALGQLRRGWPSLVPNTNLAAVSHTDLVREVAKLVRSKQLDAALILNQGIFAPTRSETPTLRSVHLSTSKGTLVIGPLGAMSHSDAASSDPAAVAEFFKSASAANDLAPLYAAWPELMPGAGHAPSSSVAMGAQLANAVRTRKLGAVVYHGVGGKTQAQARRDAPKPVGDWSMSEKLRAALMRSLDYLGGSLRSQIAEFFTPENIAQFVAVLAIFAVLQAIPILGEIVDAGLLLTLWYYGGRNALTGLKELAEGAIDANKSKNAHDIDQAAKVIARGLEHLGKGGLSLLFAWFATRSILGKAERAEGSAATKAGPKAKPTPPPPPPPPAPKPKPKPAAAAGDAAAAAKAKEAAAMKRVYAESHNSKEPLVIGRLEDTKAGSELGFRRLNDPDWTPKVNDAWMQGGIDAKKPFYLGSNPTMKNLRSNNPQYPTTVFFRELKQLRAAGYTRQGDWMMPPGK